MRAVMDGVMYILSTGCQWRYLPKDFPSYNAALLKAAVCGGLAACALGAAIYDFGRWFTALVD